MSGVNKSFNRTISQQKPVQRNEKTSTLSEQQLHTKSRIAFKNELKELGLSDTDIEISLSLQNY